MAANLTTTYAFQILDLLGLSKFKGGGAMPPDKNIPVIGLYNYNKGVGRKRNSL